MAITVEEIRARTQAKRIAFTQHADAERRNDDLTFQEVYDALSPAEILDQYEDTSRGESCLILGFVGKKPIHVVCGRKAGALFNYYCLCPNNAQMARRPDEKQSLTSVRFAEARNFKLVVKNISTPTKVST